jgi:membrane protein implicated in regulation of membrane protease activity
MNLSVQSIVKFYAAVIYCNELQTRACQQIVINLILHGPAAPGRPACRLIATPWHYREDWGIYLPMQFVFLTFALVAALVELITGTFYLAAVAVIALITAGLGFVLPDDALILVFLAGSIAALALVRGWRRRQARNPGLPDLDAGQFVIVAGHGERNDQVIVTYRGTRWDGVMVDGAKPAIGSQAVILHKTGSLLHLAASNHTETPPSAPIMPSSEPI